MGTGWCQDQRFGFLRRRNCFVREERLRRRLAETGASPPARGTACGEQRGNGGGGQGRVCGARGDGAAGAEGREEKTGKEEEGRRGRPGGYL